MAKLPDKDTFAKEVALEVLNFEINGRTFREWLEILAQYVANKEEEPKEANLFFYDAKKETFTPLKYSREATAHIKEKAREENPERLTVREWRNLDPWETCGDVPYNCGRGNCRGCLVPKLYAKLAKFEDEEEKKATSNYSKYEHEPCASCKNLRIAALDGGDFYCNAEKCPFEKDEQEGAKK